MCYDGSMVHPSDPFKRVYDEIGDRKAKPEDFEPYLGGNGRIDRAVELIRTWDLDPLDQRALVDVGGATGNLGCALRELFPVRWVIDIYEGAKDAATRKGNRFITANVDRDGLPLDDSSVSLVCALDLIEHIVDPQRFALECSRVLRPGGRVLINTPNIQYWRHLESLAAWGVFPHTSGDREVYHGGHVAFYNLHDMEVIFGGAGFVDLKMHVEGLVSSPPPPLWMTIARYGDRRQLAYADLVFSCRKSP